MSYVREVRKDELVKWLLDMGYAEEKSGFGHVSAEILAEALMARFDIITESSSPQ